MTHITVSYKELTNLSKTHPEQAVLKPDLAEQVPEQRERQKNFW